MADTPRWHLDGDWFDVCKCDVPCPCEFARSPTNGECDGVLAWHVRKGTYGDVRLDGFNVVALGSFKGNLWEGAKATMGIFIDERADPRQREALQTIFGGQAGGWPGQFAKGHRRGARHRVRGDRVRAGARSRALARRRGRQGRGPCRSVDRPDDATGPARADDQSTRLRGRSRRCRDVGRVQGRSRRRDGLQVEPQRTVEQAHPVQLERPGLIARPRP